MLGSHLPKTLRNVFFVLGMVMITMAGAMEEMEDWDHSSLTPDPAECQAARHDVHAANHG